ncbi:hypothetical protein FJ422_29655 [Mesorhizobium sp. B2-6-3]|uniref:hypothetical protein n=1 Tax=Mesorhizobium sp. B2-6-3 TaxID=2589914 RepID=UPI00112B8FE1|nr:hypothetical protein [Mesorhizobium sp. B2-6-3]TPJ76876.1 hypothetical protein FJ422_29655 [Mesorhizobium sp. B2-6-3]
MSAKWRYEAEDGTRLAELSLEAAPPVGWPVTMVGPDKGPVREYIVIAVHDAARKLVLRKQ